jgi:hypothetical protein
MTRRANPSGVLVAGGLVIEINFLGSQLPDDSQEVSRRQ